MRRWDWVAIAMTAALVACGGTPPGRCLEPPHIYVGQCIVRSVSVRDGQSVVGLDLEGSAQPPFAISVRRAGSEAEVSMLRSLVGQRFDCRIIDSGPCPPRSDVDLPPPVDVP